MKAEKEQNPNYAASNSFANHLKVKEKKHSPHTNLSLAEKPKISVTDLQRELEFVDHKFTPDEYALLHHLMEISPGVRKKIRFEITRKEYFAELDKFHNRTEEFSILMSSLRQEIWEKTKHKFIENAIKRYEFEQSLKNRPLSEKELRIQELKAKIHQRYQEKSIFLNILESIGKTKNFSNIDRVNYDVINELSKEIQSELEAKISSYKTKNKAVHQVKIPGGKGKLSANAIELLKKLEGKKLKNGLHILHNDIYGHATIGYGIKLHNGSFDAEDIKKYGNGISEKKAEEMLKQKIGEFEKIVNNRMKNYNVKFFQHEFDAAVIAAYQWPKRNLDIMRGIRDKKSTGELKKIWIQETDGQLSKRRNNEYNLFITGSYEHTF